LITWGPYVPNLSLTSSLSSLGTNGFLRPLLDRETGQYPTSPLVAIDVRDVARAHVLALAASPLPDGRHKRLILPYHHLQWKEVAEIIKKKYPEASGRLPTKEASKEGSVMAPVDTSLTDEVIGSGGYIPVEETILATFEAIMDWEKRFKSKA
jgi:nucleoside-diphosphate-sugar epimerase